MKINQRMKFSRQLDRMSGFTMVELVVVMSIIMTIMAVAMPSFLRIYRTYQLNDAATQVAGALKFTRYEAIRLNTPKSTQIRQNGSSPVVSDLWTGGATEQSTDHQIKFSGNVNLVSASTPPNTSGLATAVGVTTLTAVSFSSNAGSVTFDQRGALTPAAVDVLYIGNLALSNLGNRAVILLPSGSIQIWTTDASGNWQQAD